MTIDDMWERLAAHQPFADARGYGPAWARMCRERTAAASEAARAWAARAAAWAARAAWSTWSAADAAEAAKAVTWIAKAEGAK